MAPELEVTKKDVAETMKQLDIEQADANIEKETVSKDSAEAAAKKEEAETLMKEAETDLKAAAPLLDEATRVLNDLKKDDFYVLAGIKKPTPAVVMGMEVACHMMHLKPKKGVANKIEGDTGGYFETARTGLLSQPAKFMDMMI